MILYFCGKARVFSSFQRKDLLGISIWGVSKHDNLGTERASIVDVSVNHSSEMQQSRSELQKHGDITGDHDLLQF